MTTEQMSTSLLGRTLMVGRYDSRAVGPPDTSGGPYDPTRDPSLKDILEATSVLRYLREELGYRSDLQYQGPFGGGYPPATAFRGDWMSVRWNRNGVGDGASRSRIILRYLREDLGFRTDLSYRGLETGWSPPPGRAGGPNSRWVWNQGEATVASGTDAARTANRASVGSGDGPPGGSQPWMRRAMALDPQLRLFVAAGRYDSLNSCADNSWTVGHLDPGIAKNISLGCYAGGHMRFVGSSGRRGQTGVRPPRRQENTILMISGLTPV